MEELTEEQKEKLLDLKREFNKLQELYIEALIALANIEKGEDIKYIKVDGKAVYEDFVWEIEVRFFKKKV